ncbi:hypothetical protein LguiB_035265 [Lonicera macranthoides]
MGNGIGRLNLCFAGDAGEISRRRHDIAVYLSDPLDEGLGHSFCYIRPDSSRLSSSKFYSADSTATFRTISGAAISANTSTPLSTALIDPFLYNNSTLDKASSFDSSDSFASIPLQPIPRNSMPSVRSGPMPKISGLLSGPMDRGFLSGPMERNFISGPLEIQLDQLQRYKPKSKKWDLMRTLKRAISKSNLLPIRGSQDSNWAIENNENGTVSSGSNNLSTQLSLVYDDDDEQFLSHNLQWAQGKAGEDRVHVVISEEQKWVFVGIYDGFNGPDATDYLLNNLYSNVQKELEGFLWNEFDSEGTGNLNHSDVLKALSDALKKTEAAYLEIADMMLMENPELALMGSCVLGMLMKGDDVYLMNVGDSRAVLARKGEPELGIIDETMSDLDAFAVDQFESLPSLVSCQLTIDHSTSVEEEVERIKSEHTDDSSAVTNDRVKGSLKVTRAFGSGFLKQVLLGSRDKFLILSSDGLYQYFTNKEAVSEVETFLASFPEGDPAQHLVEQVLFRAAKKAGMDFHELLDIPQGDRRRYHDDVSIIIISFEGRIWRSSSV